MRARLVLLVLLAAIKTFKIVTKARSRVRPVLSWGKRILVGTARLVLRIVRVVWRLLTWPLRLVAAQIAPPSPQAAAGPSSAPGPDGPARAARRPAMLHDLRTLRDVGLQGARSEAPLLSTAVEAAQEGVRIDVPSRFADAVLHALRQSGWRAEDTGDTVTTEDGEDHLTTLRIQPPIGSGAAARAVGLEPSVRGAVYSTGDLVVGDAHEIEGMVVAEGAVVLGKDASVLGNVWAGGDVTMEEGAVAGDVFAGGVVRMAPTAKCSALVARRGVWPPPEGGMPGP